MVPGTEPESHLVLKSLASIELAREDPPLDCVSHDSADGPDKVHRVDLANVLPPHQRPSLSSPVRSSSKIRFGQAPGGDHVGHDGGPAIVHCAPRLLDAPAEFGFFCFNAAAGHGTQRGVEEPHPIESLSPYREIASIEILGISAFDRPIAEVQAAEVRVQ
jgi:hypothetical protein